MHHVNARLMRYCREAPIPDFSTLTIENAPSVENRSPDLQIAPIHRLPTEILIKILYRVIRSPKSAITALFQLARVCARWKNIAYQTPGLWSIIFTEDISGQIHEALKKSGQHPLVVRVIRTRTTQKSEPEWRRDLLQILCESRRWRIVEVDIPLRQLYDGSCRLFSDDAPKLERLSIRGRLSLSSLAPLPDMPIGMFPTTADKLRHLTLDTVDVPLGSSIFTALRSLNIHSPLNEFSFDDIWIILDTNRALETFVIGRVDDSERTDPGVGANDSSRRGILELPQLHRLHFLTLPISLTVKLLSHIRAPSLQNFRAQALGDPLKSYRLYGYDEEIPILLQEVKHFIPSSLRFEAEMPKNLTIAVKVRHVDVEITLAIGQERPAFRLLLTQSGVRPAYNWVLEILSPILQHPPISLSLEPSSGTDRPTLTFFTHRAQSDITALELKTDMFVTHLLEWHSDPWYSKHRDWLLPNLEHLSLGVPCPLQVVRDMVQKRYGLVEWASPQTGALLQPFKELRLKLPGKEGSATQEMVRDLEAIRAVVGPIVYTSFSE